MRKWSLSDWASVAEIVGTAAVVVSLVFVAYSLQRNTPAVSGQGVYEIYDANREIQLVLLTHPELESIIEVGRNDVSILSDQERSQYIRYLFLHFDVGERAITRQQDGLIDATTIAGWNQYYHDFFGRYLTREIWEEIRWNWTDHELLRRVERALDK